MSVRLPLYTYAGVDGFQMYPGRPGAPGIHHEFTPGLHLIAGVNGLGKSTFLLILYHGLVGPAAVRGDDFGTPMQDLVARRDTDRFRRRVADAAEDARSEVRFKIGRRSFEVVRSLHDLSLISWKLDGATQALDDKTYMQAVTDAMNVGAFSDVVVILNLIVFMFENRGLLMWSPLEQRNALRALFLTPAQGNELAKRSQAVSKANSAYRNLLYIANRDRKRLEKDLAALATGDALSVEYLTLQKGIAGSAEALDDLLSRRVDLENSRDEARSVWESAKFNYDDVLREIEALKLARVAEAFPKAEDSSRYVIARLIGDKECLACGADDGPLIEKWVAAVADGNCLVCGTAPEQQETIVPVVAVDAARLNKAELRLQRSKQSLEAVARESEEASSRLEALQREIDTHRATKSRLEGRMREIVGHLPPSPPQVEALRESVSAMYITLEELKKDQREAEEAFSEVFEEFRLSIDRIADRIRKSFSAKISDFLVERAEISLNFVRSAIGESGQVYEWPTFRLSMTSGTFDSPRARMSRSEVSMSQGEFIDLAFRLALVEAAAQSGPATMIFDAPEASLDALFMRRAGAFLAKFTADNPENRLIVTSNLTNADMIPALFGAYIPQEGDPVPTVIPRSDRRDRVVDLLAQAAPTSAVTLVGDRYKNLLEAALFPPDGELVPGL